MEMGNYKNELRIERRGGRPPEFSGSPGKMFNKKPKTPTSHIRCSSFVFKNLRNTQIRRMGKTKLKSELTEVNILEKHRAGSDLIPKVKKTHPKGESW